jgi:hypothetical protein
MHKNTANGNTMQLFFKEQTINEYGDGARTKNPPSHFPISL